MPPSSKRILITPLDWGLGHATRCILIIKELVSRNCEVQIASSGDALALLREEFPELKFHTIAPYRPEYSASVPFVLKIFLQLPKLLNAIQLEHRQIDEIVSAEKIDVIISDNRYGCWNKNVKSIFITHQTNILLSSPWKLFSGAVNFFNRKQIQKFNECWIPDFQNGITGKLSDSKKVSSRFVGMLSRFEKMEAPTNYEVLAIISGPEPQRSLFEVQVRNQLAKSGLKYFLVKGNLNKRNAVGANEAEYLNSIELSKIIEASSLIVCRSGYSSIMDLWKLGKKAIFVPTPGQTEQEYLAMELERKGIAFFQTQQEFNLTQALEKSKSYSGFANFQQTPNLLRDAIDEILK